MGHVVEPMKMRRKFLFHVAAVTVIAGGLWFLWEQREPVYEEKGLSEWVEDMNPTAIVDIEKANRERRNAAEAIREIGVDAVPMLVKMLKPDSRLKAAFRNAAQKQSVIQFNFKSENERRISRGGAIWACEALGPKAKPAIPELLNCIKDSDVYVRVNVPWALKAIGAEEPDSVVPALIEALEYPGARLNAVSALRQLGKPARRAVPQLLKCVNGNDDILRVSAAWALWELAPETLTHAVPALVDVLERGEPQLNRDYQRKIDMRISIIELLGAMGPAAKDALPQIQQACKSNNKRIRQAALEALQKIDIEATALNVERGENASRRSSVNELNSRQCAVEQTGHTPTVSGNAAPARQFSCCDRNAACLS